MELISQYDSAFGWILLAGVIVYFQYNKIKASWDNGSKLRDDINRLKRSNYEDIEETI